MKIEEIKRKLSRLELVEEQLEKCEDALDVLTEGVPIRTGSVYVKSITFRYWNDQDNKDVLETMDFVASRALIVDVKNAIISERDRCKNYIEELKQKLEGDDYEAE